MSALFRLDSVGNVVTSLLRGASSGATLAPVDPTYGIRSLLGPDYSNNLANRLISARKPIEAAGGTRTDAAATAAPSYAGFSNRLATEHAISVQSLASSAEARSEGFDADDVVKSGTLTLYMQGASYNITLAGGLSDAAEALRASGAPIEVGTASDGVKEFLTLRTREEGYSIGGTPDDALSVSETYTGTSGKTLDVRVVRQATNAEVTVDGQSYVRQSNIVADVIPETSLRLESLAATRSTAFVNQPFKAALAAVSPDGIQSVAVNRLATSAEVESSSFASPLAGVQGGALAIEVGGKTYNVPIAGGSTLGDVANRIQQSGAPVDVSIRTDGAGYKLGITNRQTGYALGGKAADALRVTEDSTGSTGQALGITVSKEAVNAQVTVNGRTIESPSNIVRNALPGFTLDLKGTGAGPENLLGDLGTWKQGQENLSDASNEVFRVLQDRLITGTTFAPAPAPTTDETNAVKAPNEAFGASESKTQGQGTSTSSGDAGRTAAVAPSPAEGPAAAPQGGGVVGGGSTKTDGVKSAADSFADAAKAAAEGVGRGFAKTAANDTKATHETDEEDASALPLQHGSPLLRAAAQARAAYGVRAYQTYLGGARAA